MPAIFVASLGCVKNLVDAETALGETLGDEFVLELDPAKADIILINTCGFIDAARDEARETLAGYLELKRQADRPLRVVAMGCWAERSPEGILAEFPDLDAIWGLALPSSLREPIRSIGGEGGKIGWIGKPREAREGARLLSTPSSYAYLKIADGCDNRCSYCAIPLIRGGLRSRRPEALLDEARTLEARGVKEIILAAQDITAYSADGPGGGLAPFLRALLAAVSVPRIRLLYAHPAHLDDETLALLFSEPRLCRYLDLPLQHVSDPILAAMGRGYGRERILDLLHRLAAGGVVVRTTFLTGFPGESEADFQALLDMVRAGWFRHMGAFAYSPEEGTPASAFPDAVPPEEARRRRDALMLAQSAVAFAWLDSRVGGVEEVLVDGPDDCGGMVGRSVREAPDSDGVILLRGRAMRAGAMVNACITRRVGYDLVAEADSGKRRRHKRQG